MRSWARDWRSPKRRPRGIAARLRGGFGAAQIAHCHAQSLPALFPGGRGVTISMSAKSFKAAAAVRPRHEILMRKNVGRLHANSRNNECQIHSQQ